MKNYNIDTIKEITRKALPKKANRRLRKAKKEYRYIKKLIYSAAKHGNYDVHIIFSTEPEVCRWLEQEGYNVDCGNPPSFSYRISWN